MNFTNKHVLVRKHNFFIRISCSRSLVVVEECNSQILSGSREVQNLRQIELSAVKNGINSPKHQGQVWRCQATLALGGKNCALIQM